MYIHDLFGLMLHVLHLFSFIVGSAFDDLGSGEEGSVSNRNKLMEDIGSVADILYKC